MEDTQKDPIVEEVRHDLLVRSTIGVKKYGVTLDRTDIDLKGWLQHLREELMDATLYIKRIEKELESKEVNNPYPGYLEQYKNKIYDK